MSTTEALQQALRLAIRQNSHDMLMTGEEIRQCEAALAATSAPAEPVGEVRRAHSGGRSRSIGLNVAELYLDAKVKPGDKLYALATSAPAEQHKMTDVQQIAMALQPLGLSLLKTATGYKVEKLGPIVAQIEPDLSSVKRGLNGGDRMFGEELRRALATSAPAEPVAPHVGETRFEGWLSEYQRVPNHIGYAKWDMRESYWAGYTERLTAARAPSRSQKLAAAGYTARDKKLPCDECGERLSMLGLQVHECAQPEAQAEPVAWPATSIDDLKPIGFASTMDVLTYVPSMQIGPRLPGVRDVPMYTGDQLQAAVNFERNGSAPPAEVEERRELTNVELLAMYETARLQDGTDSTPLQHFARAILAASKEKAS